MRKVDVAIIGAGQAGLATSHYLSQLGIEHVVLDRAGVADSWHSHRWDSFALNIPNWSFNLPGYPYDGNDPDGFMLRDEIVERFTNYAQLIKAPVEAGIDATKITPIEGAYQLTTSDGVIDARAVVVATGAYQRRNRPANDLDDAILQLNTDQFKNAAELNPGGVLVVGSGQSGCQVAEDLLENGRDVWLATGSCGWMPRRYRGRDNVAWRLDMHVFDETVDQLGHATRLACPPIQTGVANGREMSLATLHDEGIRLTGRFLEGDGQTVYLGDDLANHAAAADDFALRFRTRVDDYIATNGIDAPEPPRFEPRTDFPPPPTELNLKAANVTNVIWATGFRLDYSWIDLDLETVDGYPAQTQGVTKYAGLYFMGLQLMHTRKSGLIFGVGEDAEHISTVIAEQLGAA